MQPNQQREWSASEQCVQFNSIAADTTPPIVYDTVPAFNAALGSVHGLSWVTFTIPRSNGAVFECTAFLSKETSGTPTGKCAPAPGKGAAVTIDNLGDVEFYYETGRSSGNAFATIIHPHLGQWAPESNKRRRRSNGATTRERRASAAVAMLAGPSAPSVKRCRLRSGA